jgi:hypothetical protein
MNITRVSQNLSFEKNPAYPENGVFMPQTQEVVLDYGNFQWMHIWTLP